MQNGALPNFQKQVPARVAYCCLTLAAAVTLGDVFAGLDASRVVGSGSCRTKVLPLSRLPKSSVSLVIQ